MESSILLKPFNLDRKSTRLNSSHGYISYAVFCLKKKKKWLGATIFNKSIQTKLSVLTYKLFSIRMYLNFGMNVITVTNTYTECLVHLTKRDYDATAINQRRKQNGKREMRFRMGKVNVAYVLFEYPVKTKLIKFFFFFKKTGPPRNLHSSPTPLSPK